MIAYNVAFVVWLAAFGGACFEVLRALQGKSSFAYALALCGVMLTARIVMAALRRN